MPSDDGVFTNCITTLADCVDQTGLSPEIVIKYGSGYGYFPSLAMAVVFIVLYALTTSAHFVQALRRRPRFMFVMVAGGLIEIVGWGGRIWSHYVLFGGGYIMQICCLVIAPTFFSAALYMMLGDLIAVVNPAASPITAKKFKIIFILGDFVSLAVQAVGGGLAATASTNSSEKAGSNIMLAGIIIQLVVMIVYSAFGIVWWTRSSYHIGELGATSKSRISQLVFGMALASTAIIVRGVGLWFIIYRTAELSQNFNGAIAENQMLFLLDGIPISIAMWTLNVFHPSRLLTPIVEEQVGGTRRGSIETAVNPVEAGGSKESKA